MKKIIGLIIVMCFITTACDVTVLDEYILINNTPYIVKIEGFDRISTPYDYELSDVTIMIDPFSSYSVFKHSGYHGDDPGVLSSLQFDSVNIIFNNEKIIVQYCEKSTLRTCYDIEHNIMGYETEYERKKIGRSSGKNEYRYTYTITEEDYNNALPIED